MRRREDGASAVEFALILLPLTLLLFGLIQYGFYFYSAQTGSAVAREAARRLAVGACDTGLDAFVQNRLGGASLANLVVTREYFALDGTTSLGSDPDNAEVGGPVSVTVSFDSLDMNFPFIPVPGDATVVKTVDARVESLDSSGGCA